MAGTLDRTFQHLEAQKADVLAAFASLPPSQLHFQPAPGSWSALQVLDHLQKTEHGITTAVVETMPTPHKQPVSDLVKTTLLRGLFLLPSRVKAPGSAPQIMPGDDLELPVLAERWAGTRLRLASLIAGFPPRTLPLGVFRHPVSGWMTMGQTLSFLSAHIVHHNYQLRRLARTHAQL